MLFRNYCPGCCLGVCASCQELLPCPCVRAWEGASSAGEQPQPGRGRSPASRHATEGAAGFGVWAWPEWGCPGALCWAVLPALPRGGCAQLLLHQGCSAALLTAPRKSQELLLSSSRGLSCPLFHRATRRITAVEIRFKSTLNCQVLKHRIMLVRKPSGSWVNLLKYL